MAGGTVTVAKKRGLPTYLQGYQAVCACLAHARKAVDQRNYKEAQRWIKEAAKHHMTDKELRDGLGEARVAMLDRMKAERQRFGKSIRIDLQRGGDGQR